MAKQYSVCQMRDTGYSSSANNNGGQKTCQITINVNYRVIVTDPADPDFTGADITDLEVAFAPGVPLVNRHTYYDQHANVGMPLAVCKSKSVKRDSGASNMFVVSCSFATEPAASKNGKKEERPEDSTQPPPKEDSPDEAGVVVSYSMGVREEVVHSAPAYADDDTALGVISTDILPHDTSSDVEGWGPEFQIPVTKKVPTVTMTITQFEATWSWEKLLERGYRVNNAAWGTDDVVKAWMITNINAVEQTLKVENSDGDIVDADWHRVTYTITRNDYNVKNYNTVSGETDDLFVGHAAALPLYSPVYIDTIASPDKVRKFLTKESVPYIGRVDYEGTALPPVAQGCNYVRYDTVDEIDFDFLKWAPGDAE